MCNQLNILLLYQILAIKKPTFILVKLGLKFTLKDQARSFKVSIFVAGWGLLSLFCLMMECLYLDPIGLGPLQTSKNTVKNKITNTTHASFKRALIFLSSHS